jgi:hypothetical protein
VIQEDLLVVEDANQIAFYLEKPVWVLFYFCESTEVLELVSSFMVHVSTPPQPGSPRCGIFCLGWVRTVDPLAPVASDTIRGP